jgi:DNA (cytosine-5)-methyltransferase 1
VDIDPQPNKPHRFIRDDALLTLAHPLVPLVGYCDAIHASFPCQAHTRAKHLRTAQGGESRFPDLLTPGLALLRELDIPWVVENVPGAPMEPQDGEHRTMLCGSMFGLKVQRHRWFLSNVPITAPGPCDHSTFDLDPVSGKPRPWGVYHVANDSVPSGGRTARDLDHGKEVMGVPPDRACTWAELKEAIPPAMTEWIGTQLLAALAPPVPQEPECCPTCGSDDPDRCGHGVLNGGVCCPDLWHTAAPVSQEDPQ